MRPVKLLLLYFLLTNFLANAQDFSVNSSTYLGSTSADDQIEAVDIAPDGTIIAGGRLPGYNPGGVTPTELLGGGDGVVLRISSDGTTVKSITRVGSIIHDLEVGDNGKIAVTGDFGIGLLKSDASAFEWSVTTDSIGTVDAHTGTFFGDFSGESNNYRYRRALNRISIGSDGTVASMQVPQKYYDNNSNIRPTPYCWVYIYDENGNSLDTTTYDDKYAMDVCVDDANQQVIVAGWNPKHHDWNGTEDHPIHVPFLRAIDYNGNQQWADYDWTALECYERNHFADSRILEISMGRDGYLYAAGYIHGGDHLFKLGPKNINNNANIHISYDNFSNPILMGAGIDHGYFLKFDPATGDALKGQGLLVRENKDGSGNPKQNQIESIHADAEGNVYMAGYCQKYIKNRADKTINGNPVGTVTSDPPYAEPFFAKIHSDWQSRDIWTVFSKSQCEGSAFHVAYRDGLGAIGGEIFNGSIITDNALQSTPSALHEGFLVSFGQFTVGMPSFHNAPHFKVYPNPATNKLFIRGSGNPDANGHITLSTMEGKQLLHRSISFRNPQAINLTPFSSGIYLLHINSGAKTAYKKIIITQPQ